MTTSEIIQEGVKENMVTPTDFPLIRAYEARVNNLLTGPHDPNKRRIHRSAFEWFDNTNFNLEQQEEFLVFLLETEKNNPKISEFRTQVENLSSNPTSRPWENKIDSYTSQELVYMYYYMTYSRGGRTLDDTSALEVIKNKLIDKQYPSPDTYPKIYPVDIFDNK